MPAKSWKMGPDDLFLEEGANEHHVDDDNHGGEGRQVVGNKPASQAPNLLTYC